jgi:hypothetical protein
MVVDRRRGRKIKRGAGRSKNKSGKVGKNLRTPK